MKKQHSLYWILGTGIAAMIGHLYFTTSIYGYTKVGNEYLFDMVANSRFGTLCPHITLYIYTFFTALFFFFTQTWQQLRNFLTIFTITTMAIGALCIAPEFLEFHGLFISAIFIGTVIAQRIGGQFFDMRPLRKLIASVITPPLATLVIMIGTSVLFLGFGFLVKMATPGTVVPMESSLGYVLFLVLFISLWLPMKTHSK
jgi:hypothetical protein